VNKVSKKKREDRRGSVSSSAWRITSTIRTGSSILLRTNTESTKNCREGHSSRRQGGEKPMGGRGAVTALDRHRYRSGKSFELTRSQ